MAEYYRQRAGAGFMVSEGTQIEPRGQGYAWTPGIYSAAQIDGCNSIQVLWYVVVPILKPAIISVALFQFMWSMNDFIGPLIYVYSVDKYPIALALKMSIDVTEGAPWNEILAMASISILPSIIVFFLAQRYFVQGVTSSGIKG